ncbi:uncharacterized protein [Cardiocondyla obscurior]|uniref:uncharacterized protein n=1 Tax=Cardiocondyla obscurior TaxID=286306 RepID=UPI00396562F5
MTVELPVDKKSKIKKLLYKFKKIKRCSIRNFAKFVGSLESCCPTLKYGRVHMRSLERERYVALTNNNENYNAIMTLSNEVSNDLQWWIDHINFARDSILVRNPDLEIFTDASLSGWGAFCNGRRIHGHWNAEEKNWSINRLELKAVSFGLKCLTDNVSNSNILLRVDNTTALAYINRKGGTRYPDLHTIAKEIWDWCKKNNNWIFASYICSADNAEADFESRRLEPETEYSLAQSAFEKIIDKFGVPDMDLFASRTNSKCEKFVSWKKDPEAFAIDAFTLNWNSDFFYAFPPFILIPRVLEKIKQDKCNGIIVVPQWPAQPWYPMFMNLLQSDFIKFEPDINLLSSLDRLPHPLWKRLTLVAGILSGQPSRKN